MEFISMFQINTISPGSPSNKGRRNMTTFQWISSNIPGIPIVPVGTFLAIEITIRFCMFHANVHTVGLQISAGKEGKRMKLSADKAARAIIKGVKKNKFRSCINDSRVE
jgi:hypothetical protein